MYSFLWTLTPRIDIVNKPDKDSLIADFTLMCNEINKLDVQQEMTNIMYFTLRDGVFYGFLYEDEDSAFIHRLNPDYCRPIQIEQGVFNFAFDYSYFRAYPDALETWDPVFQSGYNAYQNDNAGMRWQILDPEKTICIKADPDLEENLPFFIGIFEALLDLIDARTLQRNKDIIQNYKLILQKIPLFNEDASKTLDDFMLELETVLRFNNELSNSVPEAVGVATTPMEVDTIDFKTDDNSSDLNSSSMKQVFDDSGVSQLIFNSNTSGSTGVEASVKTDAALAFKLVKYIERWMKRYIKYKQGQFVYDFEFLDINIFNRDSVIERELSLANSGVPNKVRLAASAGISPDKMFASQTWENEFLEVHSNWIPLQTSYTMSSKDVGRPTNSEGGDASDSTAKSRDSGESEEV